MDIFDYKDEQSEDECHHPGISPSEEKKIREAINRSDTEKFLLFTRLMRVHFMLKNAVIIKQ
ncbi:MAG: hypothetical protein M3139_13060 [Bacteroidota bacterium]|nr:hypothetical protein [Bacteroidota bacterium]